MRHRLPTLALMSLIVVGEIAWGALAVAQEFVRPRGEGVPRLPSPAPITALPSATPYAAPFSHDPYLRRQQTVARQLAVNNWTRWQGNIWALYGPDELWTYGPSPLTWAWDFPPVEQPIGQQRIYDGRGGYSSFPVYANPVAPPPARVIAAPRVVAPLPEMVPPPPVEAVPPPGGELARAARDAQRQQIGPAVQPARTAEAPRRLFSW